MGRWHWVGVVAVALLSAQLYKGRSRLHSLPIGGSLYRLSTGETRFSLESLKDANLNLTGKVHLYPHCMYSFNLSACGWVNGGGAA
jgi:hypothetical protein